MTEKMEAFARYVASGMKKSEAYLKAGYSSKNNSNSVYVAAHDLAEKPAVAAMIKELKQKAESEAVVSRAELLDDLMEIKRASMRLVQKVSTYTDNDGNVHEEHAIDKVAADSAMKAIDQLCRMCGYNAPEKVEAKVEYTLSPEADELAD